MEPIRILGGVRTPFGRAKGALAGFAPLTLARLAAEEALARAEITPERVAGLVLCTSSMACFPPYAARALAIALGLPPERVCVTLSEDAAAPFLALARHIAHGGPTLIVGADSASAAIGNQEAGKSILDRISTDPDTGLMLGDDAEATARAHGLTREELDSFAIESHTKAVRAQEDGALTFEIFGLCTGADFEEFVRTDQCVVASANAQKFAAVPSMKGHPSGTATHANIALPCDGAAALLVGPAKSGAVVRRTVVLGTRPQLSNLAAAVNALLSDEGVTLADLSALELHERSAAHVTAALKELGFGLRQKLNRAGGAIALGAAPGATALRHLLSLQRELRRGELGVVAAVGGGLCGAALIEGAAR
jgi:acetyl-CoA C-acetyltransferase